MDQTPEFKRVMRPLRLDLGRRWNALVSGHFLVHYDDERRRTRRVGRIDVKLATKSTMTKLLLKKMFSSS